ncbi:type IV secretory system conjugative DNA transfer family protein [Actinosynnema sp. CA-248983]
MTRPHPTANSWRTFGLVFPEGLDHATAARLFTVLSGLFRPVGRFGCGALPTLTFEVLSTPRAITHSLSFPAAEADGVRTRLHGVLPTLAITDLASPPGPRRWNKVVTLHRPQEGDLQADPQLITMLLGSMVVSGPDQAVMAQLVMTPVGRPATTGDDLAFYVTSRLAAAAPTDQVANRLLRSAQSAYRSLHVFELPQPIARRTASQQVNERGVSRFEWRGAYTASSLAVIGLLPLDTPRVQGLRLGTARQLAADAAITSVGRRLLISNTTTDERVLALSPENRKRHLYVVGPSGRGKTTLLENLIVDDINENFGVAYIDPKGDSVPRILDRIPERRLGDVVLYDPADEDYSVGFNLLAGNPYAVAGQIVRIFDALYNISGAPRAINLLRAAVATLAVAGYTMADLPLLLASGPDGVAFRAQVVPLVESNHPLRATWHSYEKAKDKDERADPILHRVNALLFDPRLRLSLGQRQSGFRISNVLDRNQILLVPLNEHALGDELRPLIGSLITAKFWQAAQARHGGQHRPFFWYVDEFDDMAAGSYPAMVSRARGHDVGLILAHQQPGRLTPALRADVFSNMSSKVVFQTTSDDHARILARELGEPVTPEDVKHLGSWEVMARLAVGGAASRAVSGRTLPPSEPVLFPYQRDGETVIAAIGAEARRRSLQTYGRPMTEVEAEIATRHVASSPRSAAPAAVPDSTPQIGWEDWPE